jgi:predicted unusual protein kinase regulating ubiquinone biosynthesis (AarF/ABC1/UbiB family)
MHFGNIIIQDSNKLGVIDFGCLHYMKDTMCSHLINIHKAIAENDDEKLLVVLKEFGILTDSVSELSRNYCIKYFKLQYEPWCKDSFEFTSEWWETINEKNTDLLAEWKLPAEVIYLNKVPYCLYQILVEMKASGNFKQIFTTIFEDIEQSDNLLESELEKMIF